MIDHNKYNKSTNVVTFTTKRAINKEASLKKQKKLTKGNKIFLKNIGLLK